MKQITLLFLVTIFGLSATHAQEIKPERGYSNDIGNTAPCSMI